MAMVLIIITGGQVTPEIETPHSATILDVKRGIEERLSVEVERQTLWLDEIMLQDEDRVGNYFPQRYGVLRLSVTPLPGEPKFIIWVKYKDEHLGIVRIRETIMVADLRGKIERRWGILSGMTMFHLDTEMIDDRPLSAYYITDNSVVEIKIEIEAR